MHVTLTTPVSDTLPLELLFYLQSYQASLTVKSTSINPVTGEQRIGFGKFHVLRRKENGVWKILMDADAHENTDERIFLTGKPME